MTTALIVLWLLVGRYIASCKIASSVIPFDEDDGMAIFLSSGAVTLLGPIGLLIFKLK